MQNTRAHRTDTRRSSHIKDVLTNESYSDAYSVRDGLSIFHALRCVKVQRVPEGQIKEMFEITDAYMINRNAPGTCHCLNIQADLQSKPFCRYYSTTPAEVSNPQEREKIKKKRCIKVH